MFPIIVLALPSDWLGGTSGMAVEPIEIGGRMLSTPLDMYYFTLAGVLICSVGAFNLQRSRFGRALCAVRDNELAAEVTGVNVSYYKVMAFFAGSLFAGVAGGFFAYYIRYVTTENFNLLLSIWYLGMLIVGGLSSPLGAILGTVFRHGYSGSLSRTRRRLADGIPQSRRRARFRHQQCHSRHLHSARADLRTARPCPPLERSQGRLSHLALPAQLTNKKTRRRNTRRKRR